MQLCGASRSLFNRARPLDARPSPLPLSLLPPRRQTHVPFSFASSKSPCLRLLSRVSPIGLLSLHFDFRAGRPFANAPFPTFLLSSCRLRGTSRASSHRWFGCRRGASASSLTPSFGPWGDESSAHARLRDLCRCGLNVCACSSGCTGLASRRTARPRPFPLASIAFLPCAHG